MKNSSKRIISLAIALLLSFASAGQNDVDVRQLLSKVDHMDLIEANDKVLEAPAVLEQSDDKIFTVNLNIFQAGVFNIGSSTNKRVFDLRVSINSDFITVVSNECNINCDQTQPYRKRDSNVW